MKGNARTLKVPVLSACRKSEWCSQGSPGVHFPGFGTVRVGFCVTFGITSRPLVAASPLHPLSSTGSQIPTPRYARMFSHSPHTARTLRSQRSRYQLPPKRARPSSQACFESLRMGAPLELSYPSFPVVHHSRGRDNSLDTSASSHCPRLRIHVSKSRSFHPPSSSMRLLRSSGSPLTPSNRLVLLFSHITIRSRMYLRPLILAFQVSSLLHRVLRRRYLAQTWHT